MYEEINGIPTEAEIRAVERENQLEIGSQASDFKTASIFSIGEKKQKIKECKELNWANNIRPQGNTDVVIFKNEVIESVGYSFRNVELAEGVDPESARRFANKQYYHDTLLTAAASGLIRDKKILVVGAGGDAMNLTIFKYQPKYVCFLDKDPKKCRRLYRRMNNDQRLQSSVVNASVFMNLDQVIDNEFDTVLMIKSVNAIGFSAIDELGITVTLQSIINRIARVCKEQHHIIVDVMKPPGDFSEGKLMEREEFTECSDYDLITCNGKYKDVYYGMEDLEGYGEVYRWMPGRNSLSESIGQYWEQGIFIKQIQKVKSMMNQRRRWQPTIRELFLTIEEFDDLTTIEIGMLGDSVNDNETKGHKMFQTEKDYLNLKFEQVRPKMDGLSCQFTTEGNYIMVATPYGFISKEISNSFPSICSGTCELLEVRNEDSVVVGYALALTHIDEVKINEFDSIEDDKGSINLLGSLYDYREKLGVDGIIVNCSDLLHHITGNNLKVMYRSSFHYIAVDGVCIATGLTKPDFLKPATRASFEIQIRKDLDWENNYEEISKLIYKALEMVGIKETVDLSWLTFQIQKQDYGIHEVIVHRDDTGNLVVRMLKKRPDKLKGSKLVNVARMLSSLKTETILNEAQTTEDIISDLFISTKLKLPWHNQVSPRWEEIDDTSISVDEQYYKVADKLINEPPEISREMNEFSYGMERPNKETIVDEIYQNNSTRIYASDPEIEKEQARARNSIRSGSDKVITSIIERRESLIKSSQPYVKKKALEKTKSIRKSTSSNTSSATVSPNTTGSENNNIGSDDWEGIDPFTLNIGQKLSERTEQNQEEIEITTVTVDTKSNTMRRNSQSIRIIDRGELVSPHLRYYSEFKLSTGMDQIIEGRSRDEVKARITRLRRQLEQQKNEKLLDGN